MVRFHECLAQLKRSNMYRSTQRTDMCKSTKPIRKISNNKYHQWNTIKLINRNISRYITIYKKSKDEYYIIYIIPFSVILKAPTSYYKFASFDFDGFLWRCSPNSFILHRLWAESNLTIESLVTIFLNPKEMQYE